MDSTEKRHSADSSFVVKAKERIHRLDLAASELAQEVGLPQAAKHDLTEAMYGSTRPGVSDREGEKPAMPTQQPESPDGQR